MGEAQAAKTHCPAGHSYAEYGFLNSQGRRVCRPCAREAQRRSNRKRYVPRQRPTPEERFWAKVNKEGTIPAYRPDLPPCWEWLAARDRDGYGLFTGVSTRAVRAHRFAYELLVGPIPDGMQLDHLCRNHGCVFPTHMEVVTGRENRLRGDTSRPNNRGLPGHRTLNETKEHCPQGHPYSPENTYVYVGKRGKERRCKACQLEASRRYQARKRGSTS